MNPGSYGIPLRFDHELSSFDGARAPADAVKSWCARKDSG